MLDLGYRDKRYLSKYNLDIELFEAFGIKVTDVIPVRKVFILRTDKGDKVLKRIDYSLEEFQFILDALDYIKLNFDKVIDFLQGKENKKYVEWKGELYSIMNLVEGRECEYSNPIDLTIAAKGIGQLHKASEGFRSKKCNKYTCGNFINSLKRKKEEMLFFKNMARLYEIKREFDDVFLTQVDYYIEEIDRSLAFLESTQYYKLCGEEDKISLCHHDLAHHNIIINNEQAYFIDFDYSIIDLKVHDLCNFINKATKNFAFDIDKAKLIIENYCSTNSLSDREIEVLYGMLIFPDDFYEIAKDYYTRRKEWEEQSFVSKLNRKINFEGDRREFLEGIYAWLK